MKYGYQYMYYSIHTVVKRDLDGPFIMLRLTFIRMYMYNVNSVHSLNHPLVLSFTQCSGFMMTLKGVPSTYNKDLQASLYVHLHFRNVFKIMFYLEDSMKFEDVLLQTLMTVSRLAGR